MPLLTLLAIGCGGGDDGDERVRVPDVRGMSTVDAEHALHAAGLRWRGGDDARPASRPSAWVPADPEPALVTGQRPAPGEEVARGTVVGLGQAAPFGARAIAREEARPAELRRVRATGDPRVVRVLVPPTGCFRIHSKRTQLAGDVAIANVLLRTPGRIRGCVPPRAIDGHWVRLRFGAPVTDKAIVSGPIVRPRPARDVEPRAWSRARPVSPDGRTLAVTWTSGAAGCNALAGVEADETPTTVSISVREGRPPGKPQACRAYAMPRTALVRLREPLGTRRIVPPPKPVRIPDVRGMQSYEAQHLLASLGLRWREGNGPEASRPADHDEARQLVVHQEPEHGRNVLPRTVVALERRTWLPARGGVFVPPELFRHVRPTGDPREVEVGVRALGCLDLEVGGRWRAGEVLLVRVDGREREGCEGDRLVTRTLRARFDEPVGTRAVLPLPVMRARPSDGVRAEPWDEARVASADGKTVAVRWTGGIPRCFTFAGLVAQERRRTVRLTLRTGRPKGRDPNAGCIFLGLVQTAVVRLREPLGSRRLIDGARRRQPL
ncbi:MAG TPA: PASTA domain-containing protein [Solirubrobacteraceae bacterium]|nr:PASTA domain-containing protein [Solirubrobacteraceae bacterium]